MEWEEALLKAWGEESSRHPAAYYRRKAARARQVADEGDTQAVRLRLLDEAVHNDELAAEGRDFLDGTLIDLAHRFGRVEDEPDVVLGDRFDVEEVLPGERR